MKKTTLVLVCIVALLMMSAVSYAAGPNSYPFKASWSWVSCGEITPTYVISTNWYLTDAAYDCYDVTWMVDDGAGGLEAADESCPGYLLADRPKVYDATIDEGCVPNQVCSVVLKGAQSKVTDSWYQGDNCDDYVDVTADGNLFTRKGNTAEISFVAVTGCTPNLTCD